MQSLSILRDIRWAGIVDRIRFLRRLATRADGVEASLNADGSAPRNKSLLKLQHKAEPRLTVFVSSLLAV